MNHIENPHNIISRYIYLVEQHNRYLTSSLLSIKDIGTQDRHKKNRKDGNLFGFSFSILEPLFY